MFLSLTETVELLKGKALNIPSKTSRRLKLGDNEATARCHLLFKVLASAYDSRA